MYSNSFINETSLKNQNKVLDYIISFTPNSYGYNIWKPKNFENNFPFISSIDTLKTILIILSDKGLIDVEFDYTESDNFIYSIAVLPKGYDYFHQQRKEHISFWLPLISSCVLSAIAIIISIIAMSVPLQVILHS